MLRDHTIDATKSSTDSGGAHVHPTEAAPALLGGRYRLGPSLGRGGMGEVFAAFDQSLQRHVAIKRLLDGPAPSDRARARFVQEARALAKVSDERVVRVLDVDEGGDGAPFMVIEMLEGKTLAAHLESEGKLPFATAAAWVAQAARGAAALHAAGIVHRDIKPSNIFVCAARPGAACVKLLDLGVARVEGGDALTSPGQAPGTRAYMPPELLRDPSRVSPSVDVYALGVVLYECLSGRRPFDAPDIGQLVVDILDARPPPLARITAPPPPALVRIVERAMAPDPRDRHPTAEALASALEAVTNADTEQAPRRPLLPVAAVAVAAIFLVIASAALRSHPAPDAPPRAVHPSAQIAATPSTPPTPSAPSSSQPEAPSAAPSSPPVARPQRPSDHSHPRRRPVDILRDIDFLSAARNRFATRSRPVKKRATTGASSRSGGPV